MESLNGWIESGCGNFPCAGRHVVQQLTGWQSIAPLMASLCCQSHSHMENAGCMCKGCWVAARLGQEAPKLLPGIRAGTEKLAMGLPNTRNSWAPSLWVPRDVSHT